MSQSHSPSAEHVAHQFETSDQQRAASEMGMWLFLITEVLFFGGIFGAYTVYRTLWPETFAQASLHLDMWLGAFNTFVLLTSSLTMALEVHAAETGKQAKLQILLVLTILLGLTFLGVKAVEYSDKWHHHLVPGPHFQFEHGDVGHAQIFYFLYFALTGVHAIHMVIGVGVLLGLLYYARRGVFSSAYYNPVHVAGLYWHFVDIVWIFLYPLLYLIGARG